jgi:hypothetical protein
LPGLGAFPLISQTLRVSETLRVFLG